MQLTDPGSSHSKPLLSICIATFSRADILAKTLAHLAGVCSDDVEIVLSDNCSPDHTQSVISEFAPRFKFFRAIRQPENRGPMPNFAAAISLATGKYVYTLSDDDEVHIEGLRAAIAIMQAEEGIVAVYGSYKEWDRERGQLGPTVTWVEHRTDFSLGEKLKLFNQFTLLWFPVCRTGVVQRFFTYDDRSFGFWEMAGLLLEHGGVSLIPDVFYKHFHTHPRMEYELTKAWYHDAHRAQHEAFLGRIGPANFKVASVIINTRVAPAYRLGALYAGLKREFLTARHFMMRARAYGECSETEISQWEKEFLIGMVAERLLKHIELATGVREVLFEEIPELKLLQKYFTTIAPAFSVGQLSNREWQQAGLRDQCYLVTRYYGSPGWEATVELGPSRCRAVSDVIESCRITNQPLGI